MTKKVSVLFLILYFLCSNQAFAHTSLKESTPKEGEVIAKPIQEVTLIFGTKVEQTSKITVLNSKGESIPLGNFVIEDDEIWATFLQPLENGDYKVNWTIIGEDGHLIDGHFSFTVNSPMAEIPSKDQKKETAQVKEKEVITPSKQESEQNKMQSYIIPLTIVVLLFIVIGSFLWLVRRKK
ncbi:copper resistance protein CopC [Peribacillus sp. FSL P2-0133]|uniref:copper resistance CopC family protein n=1 Tax=Peribacillus sp. FSL P2-0133 TaxID=2921573 RepID=UPI0030CDD642